MARAERLLVLVIAAVVALGVVVVATWEPTSGSAPVAARTPAPTVRPTPTPMPTPASSPTPIPRASATKTRAWIAPLTATYSLTPAAGSTQTAFSLRVDLHDGDGQAEVEQVTWGDGSLFRPRGGPAVTCPIPSQHPAGQPYRPTPSDAGVSYGHAWRHPGTYRVTVQAVSYPQPCRGSKAGTERTRRHLVVRIGSGQVTTNGPALPIIGTITEAEGASVPMTYLSFAAFDTDGDMESYAVEWGDGTTSSSVLDGGCDDGSGAYYPGSQKDERSAFEVSYRYPRRGRHRVVVTVYSAGCSSVDLQHTSRSIWVRN